MNMLKPFAILFTAALFCAFLVMEVTSWRFNQFCHQTCSGLGCWQKKPTEEEMCKQIINNKTKCCNKYTGKNVTTNQNLRKSSYQEKLEKKVEGWYFNDMCHISCQFFACMLKKKKTEQDLCEQAQNKDHACCDQYRENQLHARSNSSSKAAVNNSIHVNRPQIVNLDSINETLFNIKKEEIKVPTEKIDISKIITDNNSVLRNLPKTMSIKSIEKFVPFPSITSAINVRDKTFALSTMKYEQGSSSAATMQTTVENHKTSSTTVGFPNLHETVTAPTDKNVLGRLSATTISIVEREGNTIPLKKMDEENLDMVSDSSSASKNVPLSIPSTSLNQQVTTSETAPILSALQQKEAAVSNVAYNDTIMPDTTTTTETFLHENLSTSYVTSPADEIMTASTVSLNEQKEETISVEPHQEETSRSSERYSGTTISEEVLIPKTQVLRGMQLTTMENVSSTISVPPHDETTMLATQEGDYAFPKISNTQSQSVSLASATQEIDTSSISSTPDKEDISIVAPTTQQDIVSSNTSITQKDDISHVQAHEGDAFSIQSTTEIKNYFIGASINQTETPTTEQFNHKEFSSIALTNQQEFSSEVPTNQIVRAATASTIDLEETITVATTVQHDKTLSNNEAPTQPSSTTIANIDEPHTTAATVNVDESSTATVPTIHEPFITASITNFIEAFTTATIVKIDETSSTTVNDIEPLSTAITHVNEISTTEIVNVDVPLDKAASDHKEIFPTVPTMSEEAVTTVATLQNDKTSFTAFSNQVNESSTTTRYEESSTDTTSKTAKRVDIFTTAETIPQFESSTTEIVKRAEISTAETVQHEESTSTISTHPTVATNSQVEGASSLLSTTIEPFFTSITIKNKTNITEATEDENEDNFTDGYTDQNLANSDQQETSETAQLIPNKPMLPGSSTSIDSFDFKSSTSPTVEIFLTTPTSLREESSDYSSTTLTVITDNILSTSNDKDSSSASKSIEDVTAPASSQVTFKTTVKAKVPRKKNLLNRKEKRIYNARAPHDDNT